jgi:hypothetical protein
VDMRIGAGEPPGVQGPVEDPHIRGQLCLAHLSQPRRGELGALQWLGDVDDRRARGGYRLRLRLSLTRGPQEMPPLRGGEGVQNEDVRRLTARAVTDQVATVGRPERPGELQLREPKQGGC